MNVEAEANPALRTAEHVGPRGVDVGVTVVGPLPEHPILCEHAWD